MFWLRAGIAGLVLLIGFVGWCMYVLTSHKVVAPLQAGTNTSVPVAQPQSPSDPAPMAIAPVTPPPTATNPPPAATSRIAAVAPGAKPSVTTGTEADASIASGSSSVANAARSRPVAAPRNEARERTRRAAPHDDEAGSAPSNLGWVEPSREPANTLNPGYADPGPPVVPGPGPRYASSIPSPVEVAPAYEGAAPMRGPDAGPPIVPGPGPRYDYSSPGAVPR